MNIENRKSIRWYHARSADYAHFRTMVDMLGRKRLKMIKRAKKSLRQLNTLPSGLFQLHISTKGPMAQLSTTKFDIM